MLHRELVSNPRSFCNLQPSASIPISSKNTTSDKKQNKMYEKWSQYDETPFLPSSSPPVSDFLKRLAERNTIYNNSTNFSKLENA
jgi:hypothetical protein